MGQSIGRCARVVCCLRPSETSEYNLDSEENILDRASRRPLYLGPLDETRRSRGIVKRIKNKNSRL